MTPFGPERIEVEWSPDEVEIVDLEQFLALVESGEIHKAHAWKFIYVVPIVRKLGR